MTFLLSSGQELYGFGWGLERITNPEENLLAIFPFFAIDEFDDDIGHEPAALLGFNSVVGGQTLETGVEHSLCQIVTVGDRDGRQPHQTSISVVETFSFGCEVVLLSHELVSGNRNVASQTDRVGPASVAETVLEPHVKHVSDVLGVKMIVSQKDTVSHRQTH